MKSTSRLLGMLFLLLLGCQPVERQHLAARLALPEDTGREALRNRLREQGRLLVVFPAGGSYRQLAEQLPVRAGRRISLEFRPDTALTERELLEEALLLLGTPASNAVLSRIAGQLPFRFENDTLHFNGQRFPDPAAIIKLSLFPNPLAPANPLMVTAGSNDEAVLASLHQQDDNRWWGIGWSGLDYEVSAGNRRLLLGRFDDRNWTADPALVFDFSAAPKMIGRTAHFSFLAHNSSPADTLLEALQRQYEEAATRIRAFTGRRPAGDIAVHLYASAEEKGLIMADTRRSQVDFDANSIHTVLNDIYYEKDDGIANQLLIRSVLGAPQTALLEKGLAVLMTERWQGKTIDSWMERLLAAGAVPSIDTLIAATTAEDAGSLLIPPLAASFTRFLVDHWGRDHFLHNYTDWAPSAAELAGLEKSWRHSLPASPQKTPANPPLPFLRGFNFAHEGYAIYNGYGSRLATASLDRLAGLGTNAVAIIPYSFLRDHRQPAPIPILQRPGSENDESVVHSAAMAEKRNMITMLKPQIWMGGGHWPGDIEMQNEADWQAFFQHYSNWMLHYAMLAEIHQFDLLCIGTELARTTLAREGDWRRLIRRIRKVYTGRLTYAANWGEEFEGLSFWDDLDLIGLNCYYPLSDRQRATDKELRASFRRTLAKVEKVARRYDRPVIFTEIGFPSMKAPWQQPHDDRRDVPYDDTDQARCYRIVFKELENQSWCHGILWWKYPTHSLDRHDRGFTPMNKPAEQVVAEWFGKLKEVN